jgi:hypothetical protein
MSEFYYPNSSSNYNPYLVFRDMSDFTLEFRNKIHKNTVVPNQVKLDRALGINGKNERLTIPMTITENISRVEDNSQHQVKEGFLKRILNI